jgi:hypothetical protein
MPIYRVDAAEFPHPITLQARNLAQAAAYSDEKKWRARSLSYVSEQGSADEKVDVVLRDDYRPKSIATKIELTIGQLAIGLVLTIMFVAIMSLIVGIGFYFG